VRTPLQRDDHGLSRARQTGSLRPGATGLRRTSFTADAADRRVGDLRGDPRYPGADIGSSLVAFGSLLWLIRVPDVWAEPWQVEAEGCSPPWRWPPCRAIRARSRRQPPCRPVV